MNVREMSQEKSGCESIVHGRERSESREERSWEYCTQVWEKGCKS